MQLRDTQGRRLYLSADERAAFVKAAASAPREVRSFCEVMHHTGCRISEALALTPERIDFDQRLVVFETLKKRRAGVFRDVPVPPALLDTLDLAHGLRSISAKRRVEHLWPWSRMTAWRRVSEVMKVAEVGEGPHACPKGLRHGYGVHAISNGVPLNMLSKWMGHSSLQTTLQYLHITETAEADARETIERLFGNDLVN